MNAADFPGLAAANAHPHAAVADLWEQDQMKAADQEQGDYMLKYFHESVQILQGQSSQWVTLGAGAVQRSVVRRIQWIVAGESAGGRWTYIADRRYFLAHGLNQIQDSVVVLELAADDAAIWTARWAVQMSALASQSTLARASRNPCQPGHHPCLPAAA